MAKPPPSWFPQVARAGYAGKGVIYLIIGVLALAMTFGEGGRTTGSSGALKWLAAQSWGLPALILLALALLAYATYRFISSAYDTEFEGRDAAGAATRIGYLCSGLVYAGLGLLSLKLVFVGRNSGGGDSSQQATAATLDLPGGALLVGIAALGIGLAGISQATKAIKGSYRSMFNLDGFAASKRQWVERIAKAGLWARAVVFTMIAFFLAKAALQGDSSEAKGIGGALQELAGSGWGGWALDLVALGMACYGVYCWVITAYGNFAGRS